MLKKQSIIPAVLWGFFILYLTLKPKSGDDSILPIWLKELHPDKIAHFGFWGIWYVIYHTTYIKHFPNATHASVRTQKQRLFIVLAIITGAVIEMLQLQLNWGRSAEWLDLIADSTGVFSAVLFFKLRDKSVKK